MDQEEIMQGFFIDRNNILYREAFIGRRGKLVSLSNDGYEVRVKDKTALVMNTATEMSDGCWLIDDTGTRRSGLLLFANYPMVEANMHDLYDGVPCTPIKRNLEHGTDTRECWEFCDETDATHYLLKDKWMKNIDNPMERYEYKKQKYEEMGVEYVRETITKSGNTGCFWVVLSVEQMCEDLFL